ncbi:MAG: 1-acyl-sn-glycerol-3-phosphate acyltransferase [Firmicutes bacterium]|nr:1-acyl-sn-glycerol-3-phosphate acyltransferase [Bacillota bacterium]
MSKKKKLTLEEKITGYKPRKPSKLLAAVYMPYFKRKIWKRSNANVTHHFDYKNLKPPFLVMSNHPSFVDHFFAAISLRPPHNLTYVVNRYFYHKRAFNILLRGIGSVPKKIHQSDIGAMKKMYKVVKDGRPIYIAPEGVQSINGQSMGIIPSVTKLIKLLKIPVVTVKIDGAFLTRARWRFDKKPFKGRVDVNVKLLFNENDAVQKTDEELLSEIETELAYNDFEWVAKNKIEFKGKDLALNVDYGIYLCPRCGSEFKIEAKDNAVRCLECGNGANINKYYQLEAFDENCVVPKDLGEWHNKQRAVLYDLAAAEELVLEDEVRLKMFNKNGFKEIVVGKGNAKIDKEGFKYNWSEGKEVNLNIPIRNLPNLAFTPNQRFYLYHDDIFYSFVPSNTKSAVKWSTAVEQMLKYYNKQGQIQISE